MLRSRFALLALASLLAPPGIARASKGLDLESWLQKPGVRLLAVDVAATWCEPCMAELPRWRALHERYRDEGLRVVVIMSRDPKGCLNPPWRADLVICDEDGFLTDQLGVNELPAKFLWRWNGKLLVSAGSDLGAVEAAIARALKDEPRVAVEVAKLPPAAGIGAEPLRELVRSELRKLDKLAVVATEAERSRLDALRRQSLGARFDSQLSCEIGAEIPANALLEARIDGGARGRLFLSLLSVEKGCLIEGASTEWSSARPERSVAEAVDALFSRLRPHIEYRAGKVMPIARAAPPAPGSLTPPGPALVPKTPPAPARPAAPAAAPPVAPPADRSVGVAKTAPAAERPAAPPGRGTPPPAPAAPPGRVTPPAPAPPGRATPPKPAKPETVEADAGNSFAEALFGCVQDYQGPALLGWCNTGHAVGLHVGSLVYTSAEKSFIGLAQVGLFARTQWSFTGLVQLGAVAVLEDDALLLLQVGLLQARAEDLIGIQFAPHTQAEDLSGVQLGLFNSAEDLAGLQVGVVNVSDQVTGIQVGLVNLADNLSGLQIGLFNWADDAGFFPVVNWHFD